MTVGPREDLSASAPLRVAIDGLWLTKPRGLGRYVQELLFTLGQEGCAKRGFEVLVMAPGRSRPAAEALLSSLKDIRLVCGPSVPYPIWEQVVFPWLCRRHSADVIHHPYNTVALLTGRTRAARVVTIHDTMFLDWRKGANLYQRLGNLYRTVTTRMFRQTDRFVTISELSRCDIESRLGIRSVVIPNTSRLWLVRSQEQGPECGGVVQDIVGKDRPFFLHIGGVAPHKNTLRTVSAFLRAGQKGTKLVVIGMRREQFKEVGASSGVDVVIPGFLSDHALMCLMRSATGLIFPSLREGFGLPLIESMSVGLPVITSNRSPMREVADGAALLVDPESETEIADAITRLVGDDALRGGLAEKGRKRVVELNREAGLDRWKRVYTKRQEGVGVV